MHNEQNMEKNGGIFSSEKGKAEPKNHLKF